MSRFFCSSVNNSFLSENLIRNIWTSYDMKGTVEFLLLKIFMYDLATQCIDKYLANEWEQTALLTLQINIYIDMNQSLRPNSEITFKTGLR